MTGDPACAGGVWLAGVTSVIVPSATQTIAVGDDVPGRVHRDHAAAQSVAGERIGGHGQGSWSAAACSAGVSGAAARLATHDGRNSLR